MRILFDHQVFSWQAYGGVSRYFFEIAEGIKRAGHAALFPEGFINENVYLRSMNGLRLGRSLPLEIKGKKWLQERWGRHFSLRALAKERPEVLHPTYYSDYFLTEIKRRSIPFVLTIHDMIHEIYAHGHPGYLSLDRNVVHNKCRLALEASAVIAVSENTKKDILHWIPELDPAKIQVIYHGNSMPAPDGTQRLALPERYVLFVGQRKSYKNFLWMLDELVELFHTEPDLHLVCVGGGTFDPAETDCIRRHGLENRLHRPSIHSDRDLAELYARARCFIFPSQYEGFGIPVLEAFSCSCPVVLHAVSSLPEVGGDAAAYFQNGAEMRRAVQNLLDPGPERSRQVEKGLERGRQFSWQKSAAEHLGLYKKVINV